MRHHLAEGWTLSAVPGSGPIPPELHDLSVPATVPGCVHTDLLEVGLIPDPYLDRNEAELQWLGVCAWRYQCSFEAGPELLAHERVELVCEGLDTVASLELNGEPLGEAANMHRPHRFDLGGRLRSHNDLVITFHSSLQYAEALRDTLGERPNAYPLPFNFVRKMACNFGWDWGPTLVTAGIWQPIYLEAWSGARIASLRPLSTLATGLNWAQISLQVELDWAPNAGEGVRLEASLPRPDRIELGVEGASLTLEPGQREAVLRFEVDSPLLWWPRGHGEQPLYDLEVLLSDGDDRTLARRESRIGFRRVELDTTTDATGSRFAFRINDKEIFVRGANWIPDDCFPTRVDEERYRRRIKQACDANMNMLRVWGAASTSRSPSTRPATSWGCWCGRTFSSPALPIPRRSRFTARWRPRRGTRSTASAATPVWCCGTATTRTCGVTPTGTGVRSWATAAGGAATTSSCCPRSSPNATPPGPTGRAVPTRDATTSTPTTTVTAPCTCGTPGTNRTTPATSNTHPALPPSSGIRRRPPTPPFVRQ